MSHQETVSYQYSTQYDRDPYERQAVHAARTLLDLLGREAYKDWHASHGCIRIPYDVLYELAREAVRILLDIPAEDIPNTRETGTEFAEQQNMKHAVELDCVEEYQAGKGFISPKGKRVLRETL